MNYYIVAEFPDGPHFFGGQFLHPQSATPMPALMWSPYLEDAREYRDENVMGDILLEIQKKVPEAKIIDENDPIIQDRALLVPGTMDSHKKIKHLVGGETFWYADECYEAFRQKDDQGQPVGHVRFRRKNSKLETFSFEMYDYVLIKAPKDFPKNQPLTKID